MKNAPLTRRGFLRLSAIAAGSALAVACQKALTPTLGVSTASPSPSHSVKMSLGGNLEAWAWTKHVKVAVTEGKCESVTVNVDEQEFETISDGGGFPFEAEIQISEGENRVSATCMLPEGGEVESDPVIYTGRLRQVPTAVIQIALDGEQVILDGGKSLTAKDGAEIVDYIWSARTDNPGPLERLRSELTGEVSTQAMSITPPDIDGEYYLSLRVKDEAGREDTSTIYFVVENGQPRIPDYDKENPVWVEKAIVYGVIPFLFGSPAFQAVSARLDELADLGINAIWLGPINTHPVDDYGYAVEDYFGLDPAYGTKEDFRNLVQAAHERGIRVLMDFVPNHTSNTHPYFLDAQKRGPESPYWDFYDRDVNGNYTYYFEWAHLPNLNYEHPEVRQMMLEAFSYWVREFDVDGFRVDVVWGVRERRPEFWLEWRRVLKRIKPDLFLLAEATAREPYYFDNGFDVAYDWTYRPGGWAWEIVWDAYKYRLLSYNLTEALTNSPDGFHPDALIFRFLNNNDTGTRFITRHGEAVTKVATTLLLTLPGIPCLYTGDEYGLEFEPYQQLEPLNFEERFPGLRDYHKKLIDLRQSIPSLHSQFFSILKPDAIPQTVFSYIRYGESTDAPAIVLLNFSEELAEFEFDVPQEFGISTEENLYDLLAEEHVPAFAEGRMHIAVPALTARVLVKEPVA